MGSYKYTKPNEMTTALASTETDYRPLDIFTDESTAMKQAIAIYNDIIRLLAVYGIAHILQSFITKKESILSYDFITTIFFFIFGTIIFHLVIKNIAIIEEKDYV